MTTRAPSTRPTGISVRRNLFNQHLSRRPTTSSTSTSTETLRLDGADHENMSGTASSSRDSAQSHFEIVRRDHNGDYELGDPSLMLGHGHGREGSHEDEMEGEGSREDECAKERQRIADAVKLHQRDRNRAPTDPAELLDAVKASLRMKVAALSEDDWMYEAESETVIR